jgi:hypothetical protein
MVASSARFAATGSDVIVRCHDPGRRMELERAMFSLAGQDYRPSAGSAGDTAFFDGRSGEAASPAGADSVLGG